MIASLRGKIAVREPDNLVIDVGGVGYLVHVSATSFHELPQVDETVTLQIHTHVREDQISLFGFVIQGEKQLYQMLTDVSGIGPKMALNILSGIAGPELVTAVLGGDSKRLQKISGVGKRIAERIVVELKDKFAKRNIDFGNQVSIESLDIKPKNAQQIDDLRNALGALGYTRTEVERVLPKVVKEPGASLQSMIRDALRLLSAGKR